jgi:ABC-2 type transport system ATP-binding protein
MSVVIAKGLGRTFGHRPPVLEGVDLTVEPGEVLGLLGPNGGGKSTLLLLMAGLIAPTTGSVKVGGVDAVDVAVEATGSIGLITAEAGLYPLLSGWENLDYFGGLFGLKRAEVRERAGPILADLELTPTALDAPSGSYSSGMRQKVSLTRALLLRPRLLLLDEPTSNLDPLSTMTMHRAIRRQADSGVAVVLVTHDLFAASHICGRVVVVKQTVLAENRLDGERAVPEPGPLYRFYEDTLGGGA